MNKPIHKIVFMRTDRMGDVMMNLPALRALRLSHPKAWLTLICDESVADLFRGHPDLDEIMAVNAAELARSRSARSSLCRTLRKIHYDLAVVSNPDKRLHALVFWAGIPERVGYDRKWGFLLSRRVRPYKADDPKHEIDRGLDLVRPVADKAWDGSLVLPVDPSAKKKVDAMLADRFSGAEALIAVHTGTSNPKKRWAEAKFSELCAKIQAGGKAAVALIGGPEERAVTRAIRENSGGFPVDLAGQFTLKELTAFLSHPSVAALVSSDSGPLHIAWIMGTPVVGLYASDVAGADPARWGPMDPQSTVIHKPMDAVGPAEVFAALEKILGGS